MSVRVRCPTVPRVVARRGDAPKNLLSAKRDQVKYTQRGIDPHGVRSARGAHFLFVRALAVVVIGPEFSGGGAWHQRQAGASSTRYCPGGDLLGPSAPDAGADRDVVRDTEGARAPRQTRAT